MRTVTRYNRNRHPQLSLTCHDLSSSVIQCEGSSKASGGPRKHEHLSSILIKACVQGTHKSKHFLQPPLLRYKLTASIPSMPPPVTAGNQSVVQMLPLRPKTEQRQRNSLCGKLRSNVTVCNTTQCHVQYPWSGMRTAQQGQK